jgi:hypothetical protein
LHVAVEPLICFAAYIGLLQPHSDDMSRVVDQLLKLIATFTGLSRLSRSGIICCINVFTSLLGLVIVSHLSPRGLGRFMFATQNLSVIQFVLLCRQLQVVLLQAKHVVHQCVVAPVVLHPYRQLEIRVEEAHHRALE